MEPSRLQSAQGDGRRRALLAVAALVAIGAAAVLYYRATYGSVPALVAALDHCKELYCDFTRQYYPTGRDVLATGQPSKGYFYSSFFALFLAPVGRLNLDAALVLWSVVQLAGILLLLLPAIDFYHESPAAFVLYAVLLAFSMPLLHNLKWGQVSALVTGCAFAALFLQRRGRRLAAGVVLGFAAAIKYYVAVVAIAHLLRRHWRMMAAFLVAAGVFWLVIPTLILGPDGNWAFYQTVRERVAHALTTWMPEDINAQYLPSVAGRWLGTGAGRGLWRWFGYGLFAVSLLAVARLLRRGRFRDMEWAYALLFLSLPLAVETSWPHYFVYLPFAQTLAWLELRRARPRDRLWQGALLLVSVVLASMPFFQFVGRWQDYSQYGFLFVANLCLLVLGHALTLRQAAQSGRPASPAPPASAAP